MQKTFDRDTVSVEAALDKRKLWPYGEARKILKRHDYDPDHLYTFETGFGPSGFPHIGTFGEVVRTEFIIHALKEFGFKTALIAFSDDLDGLRKVPEGMPEWLGEHLGKPVSSIPDPFGECSSFSEHMNKKLREMLDWMEIDYQFRSSKESYERGEFDEGIKILLKNYKTLEEIIIPTLSEETRKQWYPFFPICESCGRVLTTVVKEVDLESYIIRYGCIKTHGEIQGCGYEGTQSALGGQGKMTWRVDWPLRWYALGIDYELYGKDLIDSYAIGKKIMKKIFKRREPENMYYEMFLDSSGAKISKSKGRGLTVEQWLTYGTLESLNLLMYRKPRQAKELSFRIIPSYVDDVTAISLNYHQRAPVDEHEYHFITNFHVGGKTFPMVSYMLICNLMTALKSTERELIKDYLSRQKDLTGDDQEDKLLDDLIDRASRYYYDFIAPEKHEILFTEEDIGYLGEFLDFISSEQSAESIHNAVYEIAQKKGIKPQHLFRIIYRALIEQDRGPRLGNFITMIGQEKTLEIMRNRISRLTQKSE